MTSRAALASLIVLLVVAIAGSSYLGLRAYGAVQRLQSEQASVVQQSAATRVVTVSQRCELTTFVLGEARRPEVVAKLRKSHAACERQLAAVKKINAQAHREDQHPARHP